MDPAPAPLSRGGQTGRLTDRARCGGVGGAGEALRAPPRRVRRPSRIEFDAVTVETDGGLSHVVAVTSRQEAEMTNERVGTHTSASAQGAAPPPPPRRGGGGDA